MTVCVRAGFDKVLPAQAMECADKTGRHGMVHGPNRSPWRVRNRLHAGSGRFPRPVWRLETPTASRLPVRFRAGILRASLMRPQSAGFQNGVRRASGAPDAGSSSSHAVGAPVNTPSRARDGVAHPPSSGRSSLSRRVRLLPQSAGVTAETADPRVVGTVSGVVHGRPVESCSEASGYSRRIAVRDGMTGAGPVGVFRRIRVAGAPHRHAATGLRRDAGPGAPGPPRTIRMDGGIRRFGDARPTACWCNGSTPALWREVRVRIPWRAPTPIRSALRRSRKGRGGSAVRRRNPHGPFP